MNIIIAIIVAIAAVSIFLCIIAFVKTFKDKKNLKSLIEDSKEKERILPKEKAILDLLTNYNKNSKIGSDLEKLGAKLVFARGSYTLEEPFLILTQKAFAARGNFYLSDKPIDAYVTPPSAYRIDFEKVPLFQDFGYVSTTNKSVVGRAVGGAIIGGATGAIIGAGSALSNGGVKTTYHSGSVQSNYYHLQIKCNLVSFCPTIMVIRNDILKKVGKLSFVQSKFTKNSSISLVKENVFRETYSTGLSNSNYTVFNFEEIDENVCELYNIRNYISDIIEN